MTGAPRVAVVRHTERTGPGRLVSWLAEAGLDPFEMPAADLPPVVGGEFDPAAVVLLGGGLLPTDDDRFPFLAAERALVADALDQGLPILGICLGAQMIAHVAGGVVTGDSGETERGSCPVHVLDDATGDPLFGPLAGLDVRMIQNHRDSITTLPPDAVVLASSERCRVQAFRVGRTAWGVQFHPEAGPEQIAGWDDAALAAAGLDRGELVTQAEADAPFRDVAARGILERFANLVIERSGPWE